MINACLPLHINTCYHFNKVNWLGSLMHSMGGCSCVPPRGELGRERERGREREGGEREGGRGGEEGREVREREGGE